jgi:hypothetical protein
VATPARDVRRLRRELHDARRCHSEINSPCSERRITR